MERWSGRVALVTGGSAGIGAALSKELVKHGMKVVACARNIEKIQELKEELKDAAGELMPVQCDLRDESQIKMMFQKIRETYGRLDICINNAGLAHPAKLLSGSTECWREMLDVNVLAPSICTREAFKLMDESGARGEKHGHIINISSMGGHRLVPAVSAGNFYSMTKAALNFHTEGVRRELREEKSDIKISTICPGRVITEFHERMYKEKREPPAPEAMLALEAEDIVSACIYMLSTPPRVQVISPFNIIVVDEGENQTWRNATTKSDPSHFVYPFFTRASFTE